jgi:RHS repeat-associated protein
MNCYEGRNGTRTAVVEEILTPPGSTPQVIKARVDYEYDDLYRLTREVRTGHNGGNPGVAYDKRYFYDAAGNRTRMISDGVQTDYTYDAANKMLTAGNSTFTYDDAGNTLTETNGSVVTTYTWDYLNRLTQWSKTGHTTQNYVYNADGMRVRVVPSGGMATDFVLDGIEIAEEIAGVGVTSYVGPGLISEISDTTRTIYHADGLGSMRIMTSDTQAIIAVAAYDAYGNAIPGYEGTSAFRYAGQARYYLDSTGLNYLKARYYDPALGRFILRDPIGYDGGINLYEYVGGNPINGLDPDGLFCVHWPSFKSCMKGAVLNAVRGCLSGAYGSCLACVGSVVIGCIPSGGAYLPCVGVGLKLCSFICSRSTIGCIIGAAGGVVGHAAVCAAMTRVPCHCEDAIGWGR